MMNARKVALFLAVTLSMLAFAVPTASVPSDHIIVNNADEVRETSVSISQDLADSLAGVEPRIVLQYSNQLRYIELAAVPGPLEVLLDQVFDRIIVQYANVVRQDSLASIPGTLQTLLGQVSDRIIFQYANTNRRLHLVYPATLINDTTSPQISDIDASMVSCDSIVIAWTTDEFADGEIVYGEQSGQYPQTVSDPLYCRHHEIGLIGLTQRTYYYRVRSTDRSGNTATSSERSFTLACIYLPLAVRNNL